MRPWVSWLVTVAGGILAGAAFYAFLPGDVREDLGSIVSDPRVTGSIAASPAAQKANAASAPGAKG